jgi:hypothetical protein
MKGECYEPLVKKARLPNNSIGRQGRDGSREGLASLVGRPTAGGDEREGAVGTPVTPHRERIPVSLEAGPTPRSPTLEVRSSVTRIIDLE